MFSAKILNGQHMARMGRFDIQHNHVDDQLIVFIRTDDGETLRISIRTDGSTFSEFVERSTYDDDALSYESNTEEVVLGRGKLTDEIIRELCIAATRNEAGEHFSEWMKHFAALEQLELIKIHRPVHTSTGIPYGSQYWSLELTEDGKSVVQSHPELAPRR